MAHTQHLESVLNGSDRHYSHSSVSTLKYLAWWCQAGARLAEVDSGGEEVSAPSLFAGPSLVPVLLKLNGEWWLLNLSSTLIGWFELQRRPIRVCMCFVWHVCMCLFCTPPGQCDAFVNLHLSLRHRCIYSFSSVFIFLSAPLNERFEWRGWKKTEEYLFKSTATETPPCVCVGERVKGEGGGSVSSLTNEHHTSHAISANHT